MKQKALLNISRLISETDNAVSPETAFLSDLDYTIRKMNEYSSGYYFKKITESEYPEYFERSTSMVNFVCVNDKVSLPEPTEVNLYSDKNRIIYHTNNQEFYVCVYSDGKPSRTYKPSSMNCIRQMYYQIVGADLDKQLQKNSDFYGICDSGTDRHLRIQEAVSCMHKYNIDCEYVDVAQYIEEKGIDLEVTSKKQFETKLFDKDRNIVFLCDGIIKYKGEYYILEIKTESSFKWNSRTSADASHKFQAITYSLELGIDKVIFIYENRDLCSKKSYLISITQEDRDMVVERINKCNSYVELKTAPPKDESVPKKICQYCDYKTVCKADDCI